MINIFILNIWSEFLQNFTNTFTKFYNNNKFNVKLIIELKKMLPFLNGNAYIFIIILIHFQYIESTHRRLKTTPENLKYPI